MTTHVAVIMGGWSAEREVSLVSGAACAHALQDAGYQARGSIPSQMWCLMRSMALMGKMVVCKAF